jgi:hypothetical protein
MSVRELKTEGPEGTAAENALPNEFSALDAEFDPDESHLVRGYN